MRPVTRGTLYGVYLSESVMIVAMDNLNAVTSGNAMVEIEFHEAGGTLPVGTRKVVPVLEVKFGSLPRRGA